MRLLKKSFDIQNLSLGSLFISFLMFSLFLSSTVDASMARSRPAPSRGQKVIETEAGLNIPKLGIAIDAVYDSKLDNLLPGYKILNVVLTNRSMATINLDSKKDKWQVTDSLGKTHKAMTHLRVSDKKLWDVLPVGLKNELEYPHMVRVGNTTKIDLIFPSYVELGFFKQLNFASSSLKKTFVIKNSEEKNLDWDHKEEKIPTATKATIQAEEKYKTDLLIKEKEMLEKNMQDTEKNEQPNPVPHQEYFDPMTHGTTIPMD